MKTGKFRRVIAGTSFAIILVGTAVPLKAINRQATVEECTEVAEKHVKDFYEGSQVMNACFLNACQSAPTTVKSLLMKHVTTDTG